MKLSYPAVGMPWRTRKLLAKRLRALELGGGASRPEDAQAARAEEVDDAGGERGLRSDHGQLDALARGEVGKRFEIGDRDVLDAGLARSAAVTGCDEDFLDARARGELPRQRVLSAAPTYDKELHARKTSGGSAARR